MTRLDIRPIPTRRLRARCAGTALVALTVVGGATMVPAAAAQAAAPRAGSTQRVVEVVTRAPIGKMLATVKGRSLYTTTSGCTGSCLTVWPPLLMSKGRTVPKGVKGLGTVTLVVGGVNRLQVTYHGLALYRFVSDTGSSVNGNGVGGFVAAHV
jgi:predicted lipoprotein with Yx(FWY)xxD motif